MCFPPCTRRKNRKLNKVRGKQKGESLSCLQCYVPAVIKAVVSQCVQEVKGGGVVLSVCKRKAASFPDAVAWCFPGYSCGTCSVLVCASPLFHHPDVLKGWSFYCCRSSLQIYFLLSNRGVSDWPAKQESESKRQKEEMSYTTSCVWCRNLLYAKSYTGARHIFKLEIPKYLKIFPPFCFVSHFYRHLRRKKVRVYNNCLHQVWI